MCLMVKIDQESFLSFRLHDGTIELRDKNFNSHVFNQSDDEMIAVKENLAPKWISIPVSNFKKLLAFRTNEALYGLKNLTPNN